MGLRFANLPEGVSGPIPTSYLNSVGTTGSNTWLQGPALPGVSFSSSIALGNLGTFSFPFKRTIDGIYPVNTPATILILGGDSSIKYRTNKFILQSITKPHNEKVQIMETFSNSHLFFFGERTKIYTMQGVVLDAFFRSDHDSDFIGTPFSPELKYKYQWALAFQEFYNKILAGTKLAANGNIAALYVNGWLIKGYPIQFTLAKESQAMPDAATFQMTWVVREEILINASQASPLFDGVLYKNKEVVNAINAFVTSLTEYERASDEFYNLPDEKKKAKDAELRQLEKLVQDRKRALSVILTKYETSKKGVGTTGVLDWE